jgi:hypothetical protein
VEYWELTAQQRRLLAAEEPWPATIRNPVYFVKNPPCGFDGVMDWTYVLRLFPGASDVDCQIEQNGYFAKWETKYEYGEIPKGVRIAIDAAVRRGDTYLEVFGKRTPVCWRFLTHLTGELVESRWREGRDCTPAILDFLGRWKKYVWSLPRPSPFRPPRAPALVVPIRPPLILPEPEPPPPRVVYRKDLFEGVE